VPVPRLLGVYDDAGWVALVYEDVEGRHPAMPWRTEELEHVMASLVRLHEALTPCPVPDCSRVVDDAETAAEFASWSTVDPDTLDEWTRTNLAELIALEGEWRQAAAGDTLLHLDLRADNMLIRPDGEVMFVDWPWGARGAPLLDVVGFAPSVRMQGGPDLDWLLARHPAAAAGGRRAADSLLAAVAGMFTTRAQRPPPPGLPTLRAFQDAQGRVARDMLAARLGNP
jgi:aminoglycoside phosphotransferase (APT) family kinase protein